MHRLDVQLEYIQKKSIQICFWIPVSLWILQNEKKNEWVLCEYFLSTEYYILSCKDLAEVSYLKTGAYSDLELDVSGVDDFKNANHILKHKAKLLAVVYMRRNKWKFKDKQCETSASTFREMGGIEWE